MLKKCLAALLLTLPAVALATDYVPDWKISPVVGTGSYTGGVTYKNYAWFAADTNCRSIAYNPTTNHLLVASRTGGNSLNIIDADTGNSVGTMNLTGIAGGASLVMSKVVCTSDGVIYLGNVDSAATPGFKLYRFANEGANYTVAYDQTVSNPTDNVREGDDIAITGTGVNTKILVTSNASASVNFYTTTDGSNFTLSRHTGSVAMPNGTVPVCAWHPNGTDYYVKLANGNTLTRYTYNASGTVDTQVSSQADATFVASTNFSAGFGLAADSSNPGVSWIAYSWGAQAVANNNPVRVMKTDALGTNVHQLTNAGGALNGSSNFSDTSRFANSIIHNHKIYVLNTGNAIMRYSLPGSVPVNVSAFSIE